MRDLITGTISAFVKAYERRPGTATQWGDPLVGFCDANSDLVQGLKQSVSPDHLMPSDLLPDATVVVVYFLPFTRELAETNRSGTAASPDWARAYAETNALFAELNDHLADLIQSHGGRAALPGTAAGFSGTLLKSRWSVVAPPFCRPCRSWDIWYEQYADHISRLLRQSEFVCGRYSGNFG